jgi:hypothetical protein
MIPEPGVALRCLSAGLLGFALGCVLLHDSVAGDQLVAQDPAVTMAAQLIQPKLPRQQIMLPFAPSAAAPPSFVRGLGRPGLLPSGDALRRQTITAAAPEKMRMPNKGRLQPKIPVPEVDKDNEEFVVFVRSKMLPAWVPCTMIKGTSVANQLVKSINTQLSKDTLLRNIGESVYSNSKDLLKGATRAAPNLAYARAIEYGFKVRDKSKPEEWYKPVDIIVIPPKDQLPKAPLEGVGKVFDNVKDGMSKVFGGGGGRR